MNNVVVVFVAVVVAVASAVPLGDLPDKYSLSVADVLDKKGPW